MSNDTTNTTTITDDATLTIFKACSEAIDYDNGNNGLELLQCVSSHLETNNESTEYSLRSYLLLLSGALIFFMQAGFAMLVAGSVRRKNTRNSMLKNILDAAGAAMAYFCVGYGFAFGGEMNEFQGSGLPDTTLIGLENFFGTGEIDLPFYFFQYTFFAASVTIVAGTLAERCQMGAYLGYSFFLTGFVYPVVAHAVWSMRGFLSPTHVRPLLGIGMIDFSGSGVVHCTGGFTALYATKILGSRRGRFYDVNTGAELVVPKPMPGHSVSLQMLGSFILWFGWYGFNPGTALLLTGNPYQAEIGALCAVNTFLASSGGCIAALIVKMIWHERMTGEYYFDLISAMNGCLAGLVAITAGCASLDMWAAFVTGAIAGVIYVFGSDFLIRMKIDDAVDAIPVHAMGGSWGCIAVGLFAVPKRLAQVYGDEAGLHPGFFYSFAHTSGVNADLLGCQVVGVLFVLSFTLITMFPFFIWLNFMGWFRTGSVQELVGLDIAYNLDGGEGVVAEAGGVGGGYQSTYEAEEDMRPEYLDAYQRYREVMREQRQQDQESE